MNRKDFDSVISRLASQISYDANVDLLFEQTGELVTFLKTKGLTVRQAQMLLEITSDFLLDEKLV